MTNCPATQKSVTPTAYLYEGKYNPTKEELDLLGEEEAEIFMEENAYLVKFVIPAVAGVSTKPHRTTKHFNFFPNQEIDVLDLMDATYGYKKIDYDYDKDE